MEVDYDYLQTGTTIGFRASRELCSNYLFFFYICDKYIGLFLILFSQVVKVYFDSDSYAYATTQKLVVILSYSCRPT